MVLIRNLEGHIWIEPSIEERKTDIFNKKLDVTLKFVPDGCE